MIPEILLTNTIEILDTQFDITAKNKNKTIQYQLVSTRYRSIGSRDIPTADTSAGSFLSVAPFVSFGKVMKMSMVFSKCEHISPILNKSKSQLKPLLASNKYILLYCRARLIWDF